MTKKRRSTFNVCEMSKCVPPLKVSPVIKTFRWTLLVLGYFYGVSRMKYLAKIEEEARPKRIAALIEKERKLKEQQKLDTIETMMDVGKNFGITEFPPGWNEGF